MEELGLLVLGAAIAIMGVVNMTGNISTIHSYHRRRVREEDVRPYGRVMGTGTLIVGLAMVLCYFLQRSGHGAAAGRVIAGALAAGLGVMLYGQIRYNKGIF